MWQALGCTCRQNLKTIENISLNETWVNTTDTVTPSMLGLTDNYDIFRCDRDRKVGDVMLKINRKLQPGKLCLPKCDIEVVAVQVHTPEIRTSFQSIDSHHMLLQNLFHHYQMWSIICVMFQYVLLVTSMRI